MTRNERPVLTVALLPRFQHTMSWSTPAVNTKAMLDRPGPTPRDLSRKASRSLCPRWRQSGHLGQTSQWGQWQGEIAWPCWAQCRYTGAPSQQLPISSIAQRRPSNDPVVCSNMMESALGLYQIGLLSQGISRQGRHRHTADPSLRRPT